MLTVIIIWLICSALTHACMIYITNVQKTGFKAVIFALFKWPLLVSYINKIFLLHAINKTDPKGILKTPESFQIFAVNQFGRLFVTNYPEMLSILYKERSVNPIIRTIAFLTLNANNGDSFVTSIIRDKDDGTVLIISSDGTSEVIEQGEVCHGITDETCE